MVGNPLLENISCNQLDFISTDVKNQCTSFERCSNTERSSNVILRESAKDTLLALQGLEAIEREIKRLGGLRERNKNRYKINELRERQQSIQSLYPWILGKEFQDSYNPGDYVNYVNKSEEEKEEMETQMASLIKNQLTHTRARLIERKEDFLKATACIKGDENLCDDLDMDKILAHTPSINHEEIFERERKKELKEKFETESLSPEERREYRRLLTKVGEADGLFALVNCLHTQRKEVKEVNQELALGALDVGIVVGTMGLGSAVVTGRLALRVGSTLSKTQKLTKAKRLRNLGIIGMDTSFSVPYMREVINVCENQINQLEETVSEKTNEVCQILPTGVKHTSDVKSCILQVSLASLPITLPILGLSGIAMARKLRGSSQIGAIAPSFSAKKAEEVLGTRLNSSQKRAVEEAHLVGRGNVGKDGMNPARIGNYTQAQLREKNRILRDAGFTPQERRQLMDRGVVGDRDRRPSDYDLPSTEEVIKRIRGKKPKPRSIRVSRTSSQSKKDTSESADPSRERRPEDDLLPTAEEMLDPNRQVPTRHKTVRLDAVGDRDRRPSDYDLPSTEEVIKRIRGKKPKQQIKSQTIHLDADGNVTSPPTFFQRIKRRLGFTGKEE